MTNPRGSGHNLCIAYEDIRVVPSSALLYDLEGLELELATDSSKTSDVDPMAMDSSSGLQAMRSEETENGTPSVESALRSFHPHSRSILPRNDKTSFNGTEFDIGKETPPENQHKDIGEYYSRLPTHYPLLIESCEQEILK